MRSIVFASGKGGVGKTSVALNMGLLLSQTGKKTVVVDADLDMANITILLGVELNPITLHNVLAGENNIADAVYEGPSKLYYVPASLNEDRKTLDYDKLRAAAAELEKTYDYLFIDCPPGLKDEAQSAMLSAQEIILIVNPEPTSVIDSLKVKRFAEKNGLKLTGVIINRATNDKTELTPKDVQSVLHVPVLGVLPEDAEVRRSTLLQTPITIRAPNSPFSRALKTLAKNITHENIQEQAIKTSLLQKLKELFASIFHKK